jgi:hypothetical protein
MKMRKTLMIAFGLVSLGALAGAQPAFADKKRVCNTGFLGGTPSQAAKCEGADWKKYGCTARLANWGINVRDCYYVDVQPGAPSVTGVTTPGGRYRAN